MEKRNETMKETRSIMKSRNLEVMMIQKRKPIGRDLLRSVCCIFLFAGTASAEIPEPPMIIFGNLQTSGGLEVSSGNLRFDFTPVAGGTTFQVPATVGAFVEGVNFVAIVDMETAPLSTGAKALESGAQYTPRVYYEGVMLMPAQLPSPLDATRATVLGPYTYVVSPQGKVVSVSAGPNFGFVETGSSLDRQITVSSVGTERVQGLASMALGTQFSVLGSGVPVAEVGIGLDAGQSVDVAVRFAPSVVSAQISDIFQVRTDGGDQDRTVLGFSDPSALPPGIGDLNGDGNVDALDLIVLLQNWHAEFPNMPNPKADLKEDGTIDQSDVFNFLGLWEKPSR
jgi:hypothetical protein